MKVFISYSHKDKEFVERLEVKLKAVANIEIWRDVNKLKVGDNLIERINDAIDSADCLIAVLSRSYIESEWVQQEIATWRLKVVSTGKPNIIPIVIEDIEIPSLLQEYFYLDYRNYTEEAIGESLIFHLKRMELLNGSFEELDKEPENLKTQLVKYLLLENLKVEYEKGNLVLFCGAGISVAAGIPNWSSLMKVLLSNLFNRDNCAELRTDELSDGLAQVYQDYFNLSPLIVAQYLKNGLGNDFQHIVRKILYQGSSSSSKLVDIICELCRPQRDRNALHSIVTFNFDDLIERNLANRSIRYKSIYKEGQRCNSTELPIYHVHGFLPEEDEDVSDRELVFSEDAYHSQFIDPFSWSNLIQLNHFNQNTCLLVGLSLTDPNLRRLLDVSMRKNPNKSLNHFIFKKRYNPTDLANQFRDKGLSEQKEKLAFNLVRMAEVLEEKDANNLGLNLIWVDEYDEISQILSSLVDL